MANINLQEKLTAIGDAIRSKTGKTEKMNLDEMHEEILAIKTGGNSGDYDIDDVTFYDYDGTIIFSCSMEDAQKLEELPTPPEHEGLVFQGWNWTLEQIKNSSVGADVGALYDTEDGAVVFNISVKNKIERENISLRLRTVVSGINPPSITVNWGDGQVEAAGIVTSFGLDISHSYAENGKYSIRVKKTSAEDDNFGLAVRNSSDYQIISDNWSIDNIIDSVYIGSDCGEVNNNYFAGINVIRNITVHKDLTLPNTGALFGSNGGSVRCLILPPTQVGVYDIIDGCKSIDIISIPMSVNSCEFGKNTGLHRIIFPDSVITIAESNTYGSKLKELKFGSKVWKIDSYAFSADEKNISEIIIPASVKMLNSSCFSGLKGLKEYHLKCETPPTLASAKSLAINTFGSEKTEIYVPKGTVDTYKAATNWAALADYIVEEE